MSNMLKKTIYYLFLLISIFFIVLQSGVVCVGFPFIERERLDVVADNTPLARSEDKPAWDYLFGILREHSETEIEQAEYEVVGFTELHRQPVEYRGRLVRISGCLVRCEWIPQHQNPEPFEVDEEPLNDKPLKDEELLKEENLPDEAKTLQEDKLFQKESNGFYESWILVRDKRDIPILVCSLTIPEQFPLGDGLSEQVLVTGFFYKHQLFLSSDNEELTTPTILAKTFCWVPSSSVEKPKPISAMNLIRNNTLIALVLLLLLWFIFRIFRRFRLRPRRSRISEHDQK